MIFEKTSDGSHYELIQTSWGNTLNGSAEDAQVVWSLEGGLLTSCTNTFCDSCSVCDDKNSTSLDCPDDSDFTSTTCDDGIRGRSFGMTHDFSKISVGTSHMFGWSLLSLVTLTFVVTLV